MCFFLYGFIYVYINAYVYIFTMFSKKKRKKKNPVLLNKSQYIPECMSVCPCGAFYKIIFLPNI